MKNRGWIVALTLLAYSLFAPIALAQDEEEEPGSSRSESFEAATGPQTENVPGGMLLVGAYGVVFVVMLGYVFSLGFRQATTAKELEQLRRDLADHDD